MKLPDIGLGTYQLDHEQTYRSVRWALEIGYRHIDTAALYGNEKQVGQAIRDSRISRQQIFVTTTLLLKWALQNNLKIIPRSASQKHIFANFNLPSELLSEYMMKCLDNLDCGFATHPQHIRSITTGIRFKSKPKGSD
ncbi:MAG: aldo/keto reductase [Pseudomonadota bacterium]